MKLFPMPKECFDAYQEERAFYQHNELEIIAAIKPRSWYTAPGDNYRRMPVSINTFTCEIGSIAGAFNGCEARSLPVIII